jgi:hypothetical protein
MGNYPYTEVKYFRGLTKSRDVFNALAGQLSKNENYLYMANGGLEERGGGLLLTENPNFSVNPDDPVFSLANYTSPNDSEFLITNQDDKVYYYSNGWNDANASLGLTADKKIRWEMAGFGANRAIYGASGENYLVKVIGNTPVASKITSNVPSGLIHLKLHKNRLFGVDAEDTLYYTEILDFEDWNTTSNSIKIAPAIDGKITGIEIWGDALFIFKERGVYVLPNADMPVPKTNWNVLRTDAIIGSQSIDTIKRTKIGIIYLSTDNYIRLISPNISFSSGEYTLGGSGSPIISEDIQDDIIELLDTTNTINATAIFFQDKYIISFQSVNNSLTYNDLTYFCDTTKFNLLANISQPQPYWGQFTGFDYNFFATQTQSNKLKLYGVKGLNGEVHETLNNDIHSDNNEPIVSKAILSLLPMGSAGTVKRINKIYFTGETDNWNINLVFNAYRLGKPFISEGEGISRIYTTSTTDASLIGTAIVGTAVIGNKGVSSTAYSCNLRGNYFLAEFGNSNANEFTRVLKLIVYYRNLTQS